MSLAPEPRTLRSFFRAQLAALVEGIAGIEYAALASEDGMLLATAQSPDADDTDRGAALVCSMCAVARTATREFALGEIKRVALQGSDKQLLIEPFITQQDSGPRRRLLFIVFTHAANTQHIQCAMQAFITATGERLNPPAPSITQ